MDAGAGVREVEPPAYPYRLRAANAVSIRIVVDCDLFESWFAAAPPLDEVVRSIGTDHVGLVCAAEFDSLTRHRQAPPPIERLASAQLAEG